MPEPDNTQTPRPSGRPSLPARARLLYLTWAPFVLLVPWLAIRPWLWTTPLRLATLGLSCLWVLCWALADTRHRIAIRNLVFAWLIWVFEVTTVFLEVASVTHNPFDVLPVVALILLVAVALAYLHAHLTRGLDAEGDPDGPTRAPAPHGGG